MDCQKTGLRTVIVVGAGIIGLMTIKVLRALDSKCWIITLASYSKQAEKALQLGSNECHQSSAGLLLVWSLIKDRRTEWLTPNLSLEGNNSVNDFSTMVTAELQKAKYLNNGLGKILSQ